MIWVFLFAATRKVFGTFGAGSGRPWKPSAHMSAWVFPRYASFSIRVCVWVCLSSALLLLQFLGFFFVVLCVWECVCVFYFAERMCHTVFSV